MTPRDRQLTKEVLIVLIIKLCLLYGIWSLWIAHRQVTVSPQSAADHLLSAH
jgi:hypothetical protein